MFECMGETYSYCGKYTNGKWVYTVYDSQYNAKFSYTCLEQQSKTDVMLKFYGY